MWLATALASAMAGGGCAKDGAEEARKKLPLERETFRRLDAGVDASVPDRATPPTNIAPEARPDPPRPTDQAPRR